MVVDAARAGDARTASEVAVLLTERGLGGDSVDLARRLDAFAHDRSERANDARRLARALAARALIRTALRGRGAHLLPQAGEGCRPLSRLRERAGGAGRASRLGLPRPHRDGARQARRIPHGQRARRGAGGA